MNVITLFSRDIRAKAAENRWPTYTEKVLNQINEECLIKANFSSVFIFFKENKKDIYAYMPTYEMFSKNEMPIINDIPNKNQKNKIIGIKPVLKHRDVLKNEVIEKICEICRYETNWNGDEAYELI
jgi:hypothetical protein